MRKRIFYKHKYTINSICTLFLTCVSLGYAAIFKCGKLGHYICTDSSFYVSEFNITFFNNASLCVKTQTYVMKWYAMSGEGYQIRFYSDDKEKPYLYLDYDNNSGRFVINKSGVTNVFFVKK